MLQSWYFCRSFLVAIFNQFPSGTLSLLPTPSPECSDASLIFKSLLNNFSLPEWFHCPLMLCPLPHLFVLATPLSLVPFCFWSVSMHQSDHSPAATTSQPAPSRCVALLDNYQGLVIYSRLFYRRHLPSSAPAGNSLNQTWAPFPRAVCCFWVQHKPVPTSHRAHWLKSFPGSVSQHTERD